MSATLIMQAVLGILQTTVADMQPPIEVYMGPPRVINTDRLLYCYHDGSTDSLTRAGPSGPVRRTHTIPMHLMLLTTADDMQTELDLLTVHDILTGAFYANHTLTGNTVTTELKQRDGTNGTAPLYMAASGKEYRQRWWTLDAIEELSVVLA